MEFTSLSPDAQIISLGIVSDDYTITRGILRQTHGRGTLRTNTFYAEFSDFDIERCDDWVKENVVKKLSMFEGSNAVGLSNEKALEILNKGGISCTAGFPDDLTVWGSTSTVQNKLLEWLSQFSDYQIQFIVDCGTYDWWHFIQLIAEWEYKDYGKCNFMGNFSRCRVGLPKLPENISPVPFDLNCLIAVKKGITPKEAFDLNREELLIEDVANMKISEKTTLYGEPMQKHNALFDAKVIKEIYNKLK